ncbi:hypothetical protein DI392_04215 [Vibrio albus]|uniref:YcgL domain-containing protein DI392_04215 n=1 Tax=Vibrio albus TaxID=2200953 RepID=A0A2U3BC26_9VIBR|nr:YcgL domain-containing protein [Vibrio albus]PWI34323.1 hypothetical protein DI392_04215 [Vibrio albus]
MLCSIYKSTVKDGAYLYVPNRDNFTEVPEELLKMFGKPVFVMMIKLDGRKLAQVDVNNVQASIQEQGFFLQLPPPPENVLEQFKDMQAARDD